MSYRLRIITRQHGTVKIREINVALAKYTSVIMNNFSGIA
jgi:hypothetical protein